MSARPYVLLSCAISVDGYLDDATPERLLLSNAADFDRVDEVRADCDAILIGARTVRRDDPRLMVRSSSRRARRRAAGRPEQPVKVTVTASGDLDPGAAFFSAGPAKRLVYTTPARSTQARRRLGEAATVVAVGDPVSLGRLLDDLAARNVERLMVEGGGQVLGEFLTAGLADELQLTIAPVFVGDERAPRFAPPGRYPHGPDQPMRLANVERLDEVVRMRYLVGGDHHPDHLS